MSIFDTHKFIWQTVLEIFKILLRTNIKRKFIFFPAMKFIFSCTINSFKYYHISSTTLNGITLFLNFMSLSSTKRNILACVQILWASSLFVNVEDVTYKRQFQFNVQDTHNLSSEEKFGSYWMKGLAGLLQKYALCCNPKINK